MHAKAKKIVITTERYEVITGRGIEHAVLRFCPECNEHVEMMKFDTAIILSGIGGRKLIHLSASGEVHSVESATGHLLICKRSLLRRINC